MWTLNPDPRREKPLMESDDPQVANSIRERAEPSLENDRNDIDDPR
jgi:hypothetical protein